MTFTIYLASNLCQSTTSVDTDDTGFDYDDIASVAAEYEADYLDAADIDADDRLDADNWDVTGVYTDDDRNGTAKLLKYLIGTVPTEDKPIKLGDFHKALAALEEAHDFEEENEGAVLAYIRAAGDWNDDAIRDFGGHCENPEAYAREYVAGTLTVPDSLAAYIDYEAMGNDMLNDMTYDDETGYFWNP